MSWWGVASGLFCLAIVACSSVQATQYTFTKIATHADGFSTIYTSGFQVISDSGNVLIAAYSDASPQRLTVGDGTSFQPVPLSGSTILPAAINSAGMVAAITNYTAGTVICVSDGFSATILDHKPQNDLGPPDINNSGQVSYSRRIDPGLQQIVVTDGVSTTIIADNVRFSSISQSSVLPPDLNNLGQVVFSASGSIYVGDGSETEIANYTKIASSGIIPVIDDSGLVAFTSNVRKEIYYGDGGPLTTLVDTTGPFAALDDVAINNDATIAFKGALDTGVEGIYTGPDPIADKIIASGDELYGSTVSALRFGQHGLNNHGEIAFWALLRDGTEGIFKASPVLFDPADLNQDGKIDIFDVAIVSNHWGESGPQGDANGDGLVDIFDVAVISNNWSSDGAKEVPEPGTMAMLVFGLASWTLARRRTN